jgi:hypothetical protein
MQALITVAIVYAIVSSVFFLVGALVMVMDGDYLHEIPTPIKVVTFLPLGAPFYITSWARERKRVRRAALIRHVETVQRQLREMDDDEMGFDRGDTEDTAVNTTWVFEDDQPAAEAVYASLRGDKALEALRLQKQEVERRFNDTTEKLKELSEEVRNLQQRRQEAAADLRQVEEHLQAKESAPDTVKAEELAAEFSRIREIMGVQKVRQFGDSLSILVQGSIRYNGQTYDKGVWELRVTPGSDHMYSHERRRGLRDGWRAGSYPDYRLSDNQYCFGDSEYTIRDNLRNGQYLQAIELAVTCINSVNEWHRDSIPNAFKILEGISA